MKQSESVRTERLSGRPGVRSMGSFVGKRRVLIACEEQTSVADASLQPMGDDSARHHMGAEFVRSDSFPSFLQAVFSETEASGFNAIVFNPVFERRGAITRINAESIAIQHRHRPTAAIANVLPLRDTA